VNKRLVFEFIKTIVAIIFALALAFTIIYFVSEDPAYALNRFLVGPTGTMRHFGNVLEMAIPLTFTGLAICVMFQARQFNIGADGGFFIGAVGATFIAITYKLPPGVHTLVAIAFGGLLGGLGSSVPALLKAKWKSSELVSSLMMNHILFLLGLYVINNKLRDPQAGAMASYTFNETANLSKILEGTRLHSGIFIALLMIALTYYFLYRTKWGYALRMTGKSSKFAQYSGISVTSVIIYSQVIGGILAGIGGATEMLGMHNRFQWQLSPGFGWDGIIVAVLARNNPLLIPIAAFFLAYMRIGADLMSRMADVPSEVVSIVQSIMIMLVTAEAFLSHWRHKLIVRDANVIFDAKEVKGNVAKLD